MCPEPFVAPFPWNCYPTWSQFETMMQYYATTYPAIARLVNLGMSGEGTTSYGRSRSPTTPTPKRTSPRSSTPGPCTATNSSATAPTVHLIDHILANYGSDAQITRLVDETVLWLNPLSNPDGTFGGGDSTVSGAGRYLPASGVDPNRSFPDPERARGSDDPGLAHRGPGDDRFRRRRALHPCRQLPRRRRGFQLPLGCVERSASG